LVTEQKVCLWLLEDILKRRVPQPALRRPKQKQALGRRKRGSRAAADAAIDLALQWKDEEEEDLAAIAA
jgi:hypothetical protein